MFSDGHHNASLKHSRHVRAKLLAPLFDGVVSVMLGHAIPWMWMVLLAAQTAATWPLGVLLIYTAAWLARIVVLVRARRDQVARGIDGLLGWKAPFQVVGLVWAAAVGISSFMALVTVPNEATQVIAITVPLGLAAAISSRNSGTPKYAAALMVLLLVPLPVGAVTQGSDYWAAALMHVAFFGSVLAILKRSHTDTVNLLVADQKNAHLAARLDVALANMKQGLTLFDPAGLLEIVNRRFCEIFSVKAGQISPGISAANLLDQCRDALVRTTTGNDAPAQSLESLALTGDANGTICLTNGNIIAVTHEALPDGGWLTSYEDITERRRGAEKVEHMAYHDALTGLANRIRFNERLDECLARLGRGDPFAVLYLDLDKFKPVNDTFGHAVGDRLLQEAASRMAVSVRKTDVLARLGGDEFAVLITHFKHSDEINLLAQRLLETVTLPYWIANHEIVISTCIGVALAPDDGVDVALLLKKADQALYSAKSRGSGRIYFSSHVLQSAHEQSDLVTDSEA